jgi:hypothetical protein
VTRIYTGAEARALREAAGASGYEFGTCAESVARAIADECREGLYVVISSDPVRVVAATGCEPSALDVARLLAAAPDLAATVEALEAERDALRAKVDEAREAERSAVVVWLRERAGDAQNVRVEGVLFQVSDRIERGDHVAKEDR